MILTRDKILAEVQFEPSLDTFQVNPHSIDLRLDCAEGSKYLILPGATVRFMTIEKVSLPDDVMGIVYPRSSANRRGLNIHMTGVVDAGYSGKLTIPITNASDGPIAILHGERIASIVFHRLEDRATTRLSKYHGGDGSYVPDKEEETRLLEHGRLDLLKEKHAIN